ncbi:MAG: hypothetical protein ABSB82_10825 [Terriglobia bacterium]
MTCIRRTMVTATVALLAASLPAWGQTRNSLCDEIAKLKSDVHEYVPPWPRWQDEEMTPVDQRILRLRVKAIPSLIACLTDERRAEVLGGLWGEPSVGMVAFSMLSDLFTACEGEGVGCRHTIKGVITWDDLCNEGPSDVILVCGAGWEAHLKKFGRQSVQQSWQKAWMENKDRIYWDESAKCFRVKKI